MISPFQPDGLTARERSALLSEIIEWDVPTWSHCLPFWMPRLVSLDPSAARILAIGERHGGISLWFALQGFRVICSDFGGPTQMARERHRRFGVQELVTYEDINVFSIHHPDNAFDVVTSKSVIGGLKLKRADPSTRTLANQHLAVNEIRRVLKPGGSFLGAENLVGTPLHRLARHIAKRGKVGWRHLSPDEISILFDGFSRLEQRCYGFLGGHVQRLGLHRIAAAIDSYICPLLPQSWLYASFIRATK